MSLRGPKQVPESWPSGPSGPHPQCRHLSVHPWGPSEQDIQRQLLIAHTYARHPEPDQLQALVRSVQHIQVQLHNAQKTLVGGQKRSQKLSEDVQTLTKYVQKLTKDNQKLTEEVQKIATRMNELDEWHHCQCRCNAVKVGHETDASPTNTTQHERAAQSPVESISAPRTKRLVPAA
jgi:outer membrane murein-binding lipoprotein Lpp